MVKLFIIGGILVAGLLLLRHLLPGLTHNHTLSRQEKKRVLALGLIGLLLGLIISGKAHWLMAVAAASFGALRAFMPLLIRYLPHLGALYRYSQGQRQPGQTNQTPPPASNPQMSKQEACTILGVSEDADRAEILAAYKRLMQRCHPDRGGSDYLATQLNHAKKRLLG